MIKETPERGILTGNVPLTPIQKWFFDKSLVNIHHFNQSILLEVKEKITLHMVKAIFNVIAQYHDVFRMRYKLEDKNYVQEYTNDFAIEVEEREIFPEKIYEDTAKTQTSLNIFNGPIVKVVLYRCSGENDRLFIVAHHLVVDGVSWRIIMDDIETIYRQFMDTGRIALPAKTHSYRQWANSNINYVKSENGIKEQTYWKEIEKSIKETFLEPDFNYNDNRNSNYLNISLNKTNTKSLIQELPKKYDAQINDVLLTALTLAVGDISGNYEFSFTLEGHGREEVMGLDVSRTIGWFTSVFPVFLKITNFNNLKDSIREIKNFLSKIPNKGIGYGIIKHYTNLLNKPLPKVSFNYLGQWDSGISEQGVFQYAKELSGEDGDIRNHSDNLIDMNGGVKNGIFEMCFGYNAGVYKKETIERFANCFKEKLLDMIYE